MIVILVDGKLENNLLKVINEHKFDESPDTIGLPIIVNARGEMNIVGDLREFTKTVYDKQVIFYSVLVTVLKFMGEEELAEVYGNCLYICTNMRNDMKKEKEWIKTNTKKVMEIINGKKT